MITRSKALHRDQRQLLGLEEDTREEHRYNGGRFSVASVNSLDSLSPKSKVAKARHSARAAAAAAAVKAAAAAAAKAAYAASSESVTDGVEAIIAATDARLAQVAFDSELADRWGGAVDRVNIDYQACSYDRESLELAYTVRRLLPLVPRGALFRRPFLLDPSLVLPIPSHQATRYYSQPEQHSANDCERHFLGQPD